MYCHETLSRNHYHIPADRLFHNNPIHFPARVSMNSESAHGVKGKTMRQIQHPKSRPVRPNQNRQGLVSATTDHVPPRQVSVSGNPNASTSKTPNHCRGQQLREPQGCSLGWAAPQRSRADGGGPEDPGPSRSRPTSLALEPWKSSS
jgi:hypothetical protein